MRYKELISEAKSSTLYHLAPYFKHNKQPALPSILHSDSLNGPVSLTRDKNYKQVAGNWGETELVRLWLNQEALHTKYKVTPYLDSSNWGSRREAEERINIKKVTDLHRYLSKIELLSPAIDFHTANAIYDYTTKFKIPLIGNLDGWLSNVKVFDIKDCVLSNGQFIPLESYIIKKIGSQDDQIDPSDVSMYLLVDEACITLLDPGEVIIRNQKEYTRPVVYFAKDDNTAKNNAENFSSKYGGLIGVHGLDHQEEYDDE